MGAPENKQLLHQIFEELSKGDSEPFVASMADDFRWTVTGTTKWSRTYEGKRVRPSGIVWSTARQNQRQNQNGGASVDCRRRLRRGGNAGGATRQKRGVPYNNNYCFVFRLSGNQLKEVTEYFDTELVTAALGHAEA